jgi:hypothetical protein
MVTTSLASAFASPFSATSTAFASPRSVSQSQAQLLGSSFSTTNGFPVFGGAPTGFHAPAYSHPHGYGGSYQHPQHQQYGNNGGFLNGLMPIIQLVLQKLFQHQQQPKQHTTNFFDDEAHLPSRNTTTRTNRRSIIVNGKAVDADDEINIKHANKKRSSRTSETAVVEAKKADLPKGVKPLSYNKLMDNKGYYTEAKEALVDWQAHMKKHEGNLHKPKDRNQWIKGALAYLALLNQHEVRDEFLTKYPQSIATYYNSVLRTLRQNDDVREAMLADPANAKVLAIVDKTNKAIFEHTIFKAS